MRIVVVGATGNVGTALLRRLAAARLAGEWSGAGSGDGVGDDDLQVVGVARRLPDARVAPYDVAVWHALDVGDPGVVPQLAAVLQGADAVVHLAWALQPTHDIPAQRRTDVDGQAHVLEAAVRAGVGHVVIASSVGAYRGVDPAGKRTPVDETWPATGIPTATYSKHKAANEAALDAFAAAHPTITVSRLRPGWCSSGTSRPSSGACSSDTSSRCASSAGCGGRCCPCRTRSCSRPCTPTTSPTRTGVSWTGERLERSTSLRRPCSTRRGSPGRSACAGPSGSRSGCSAGSSR